MKRKQLGLLIAAVLLVAPVMGGNTAVQAKETSGISCVLNGNKQTSTNTLGGTIKIKNTTGKDIDLSKVTIDYYYSADSNVAQNFWCDYCGITKGNYQNFTSAVKGSFEKTGSSDTTKSDVIKITFTSGVLKAGDEADLQFRVSRNDWSNYDQSNDYAYNNGLVVDGETTTDPVSPDEPEKPVKVTPVVSPSTVVYDQNAPKAITTTIDYKGHAQDAALESIVEDDESIQGSSEAKLTLKSGSDYVNVNGNVRLNQSYLNTLDAGKNVLIYNFKNGTSQKVVVNVIEKEIVVVDPVITPDTAVFDKNEPADIVVNVTYNDHNLTALKNGNTTLKKGTDYTVSGNKVTLKESCLNNLADGDAKIGFIFDGSIEKDLNVTVKPLKEEPPVVDDQIDKKLNITADSVKAKAGQTVKIPVLINIPNDVDTYGVGFDFKIDSNKAQFVKVTKGVDLENAADVVVSNYVPANNAIVNYALFPNTKGQTASLVHGKYEFATFELKLNSDLKSGDKLPINIVNMTYGDKNGKAMDLVSRIGEIVIQ